MWSPKTTYCFSFLDLCFFYFSKKKNTYWKSWNLKRYFSYLYLSEIESGRYTSIFWCVNSVVHYYLLHTVSIIIFSHRIQPMRPSVYSHKNTMIFSTPFLNVHSVCILQQNLYRKFLLHLTNGVVIVNYKIYYICFELTVFFLNFIRITMESSLI